MNRLAQTNKVKPNIAEYLDLVGEPIEVASNTKSRAKKSSNGSNRLALKLLDEDLKESLKSISLDCSVLENKTECTEMLLDYSHGIRSNLQKKKFNMSDIKPYTTKASNSKLVKYDYGSLYTYDGETDSIEEPLKLRRGSSIFSKLEDCFLKRFTSEC